jgi:hypothetical protein
LHGGIASKSAGSGKAIMRGIGFTFGISGACAVEGFLGKNSPC